jgi:16S rRNA (uracil1498-N3)-methyltransferase
VRISRVYFKGTLASGLQIILPNEASHYLLHVLRLKIGDPLILFNGEGGHYQASLVGSTKKKEAIVLVGEFKAINTESPLKIHLAQGISKGEKMDFVIQKAVELGVTEITPLITEFCAVKVNNDRLAKRQQHWFKVIISACEQSGRTGIARLNAPQLLTNWIDHQPNPLKIYCQPGASNTIKNLEPAQDVLLLIGPEGGLSKTEIMAAQNANFKGVTLGSRILRTETAALSAISVVQSLWGDLN